MSIITDISLLRQKSSPVLLEEVSFIRGLLEQELNKSAMQGNPGIGLAAPQIGIYKRMAIIRYKSYKIDLINAEIENKYDSFVVESEGCLSFPGIFVNTIRYNEVHINNYTGKFIATGLLSVACQHELDHLDGILLTDLEIKPKKEKLRPNDKCSCGSGKKYKVCHGNK